MPVAFSPREYGSSDSYRGFAPDSVEASRQAEKDIDDLFGEG